METRYYTLDARRLTVGCAAPASGESCARELVYLKRQTPARPRGQVIDLAAWQQAHQPQDDLPAQSAQASTPAAEPVAAPSRTLVWGEWLATLSVVLVMALLMWRIVVA